ncbi:transposase [Streptomyces virginiae]
MSDTSLNCRGAPSVLPRTHDHRHHPIGGHTENAHLMVFAESSTAEALCRFLDRLAGHFDRKVHLVVDGHSAHRSKKVRDWLAAHPDDAELHFLPPYSPELNPDELVNADLKHSLPRQHRARNQAELAAETRRFFRRRQRQPHIIRGLFGGPHVRYVLDENPMSF